MIPGDTSVPTAPPTPVHEAGIAPPPAKHQVDAFNAAKLQAAIVTGLGLVVTLGGAILDAATSSSLVSPHAHYVVIAGAVIAAAGRLEAAIAHMAFQQGTDNG